MENLSQNSLDSKEPLQETDTSNIANTEEEKQLIREKREKNRIDSQIKAVLNDPYYREKQVSKYPRNIYYSKLLIDEKKRPKELQGVLCIQPTERKIDIYQSIKDRFAIDEDLFIDTQYDIEDLSDEETKKSFKKEK